jgi:hypothetical protein
MYSSLTVEDRRLLGYIFYRVKRMIVRAVEDGDCLPEETPSDRTISETLQMLYESRRFDLVTLEDRVFENLLGICTDQIVPV